MSPQKLQLKMFVFLNGKKKKRKKKEGKAQTSLHFVVTESTHNIGVPQWVELAAAVVHHSRQPGMKPWGRVAKPVIQALLLYATYTDRQVDCTGCR